jgi:SAM-dependent methyltransferase
MSSDLLDLIADKFSPEVKEAATLPRLHLGCGKDVRPGWVNLDISPASEGVPEGCQYIQHDCDSTDPLPFEDNSIGYVEGAHFFEHLSNTLGFMEKLHRVCAPGSLCRFMLPHGGSDDAWEDPTHKRAYTPNSFIYFAQPTYYRADYGFRGDWNLDTVILKMWEDFCGGNVQSAVLQATRLRNTVAEMEVVLRCIKPIRPMDRSLMTTYDVRVMPVKR